MGIYRHIDGVQVAAAFSPCRRYRYRLEVTRNAPGGGHPLTVCAILQNPSVADADIADRSVQFLEKLVFMKGVPQFAGVGRLIIVNQFALIQTRGFVGAETDIGPDNDRHLARAIAEADIILIAWGKSNAFASRKQVVDRLLAEQSDKLLLQGKSHPSRASYTGYVATRVV
ncbi:DUF1643 domain-containing protein [Desulfoprunum benzoelyticum]|uniref:DUF1643 domain-containing protein n=1 Tax=Desulfoprunum benzoelyticum TaxID=1506996 RepID=A0A840USA4_9BACT|nr:DUF1643 domain-containing protein [Desulfoprunum benzoelyticum]MBB5347573.1 hypothetical protein [Desulfoprunum benzoelyticum]MBM9531109.1 DUF1643 domain-containing protein [Desulfoprunum benzoelyticum]